MVEVADRGTLSRLAFWLSMAGLGLAVLGGAGSAPAQPGGTPPLCTLSEENTKKAVDAFERLMGAFHHPRCANCHNAVDPFAARGHLDIRDELRPLRERNELANRMGPALTPGWEAVIDRTHLAILRFTGDSTGAGGSTDVTPNERIDMMFGRVCNVCHDPPSKTPSWRMAPSFDSFHDKDRVALCRHMHIGSETNSPAAFLKHMEDDASGFIPVAFAGTRGLSSYGETLATSQPFAPQPIASPTFDEMKRVANDWVDAQGGRFAPNAECGCRPFHYKLHVRQVAAMSLAISGGTAVNRGASEFDVPIAFAGNGEFDGQATVSLKMKQDVTTEGMGCTSETSARVTVRARGRVQEDGQMPVILDLAATPQGGSMTCRTPIGVFSNPLPAGARIDRSRSIRMQAELGATGQAEMVQDDVQSYTFDLTLTESDP
jgi:hypothetical protein